MADTRSDYPGSCAGGKHEMPEGASGKTRCKNCGKMVNVQAKA